MDILRGSEASTTLDDTDGQHARIRTNMFQVMGSKMADRIANQDSENTTEVIEKAPKKPRTQRVLAFQQVAIRVATHVLSHTRARAHKGMADHPYDNM